ncbi:hypothetical protein OIU77_025265 [Salix suchowensis]|uniref:Uncharacterized protein n=1 Tax=Salix suchowensis TaxID=1278906 RepID=A0ABQ9BWH7_9ROSI|nr:hypothetical protein OIU77_025265 [Salix suchowensis]
MAMEKENSANFTYMGRSFSELTVNDDSLAFSDCNSDKSGEFPASRQKEIAVSILLQICEDNMLHCSMVAREGAIPPLVALSQSGTNRAKQKAEALIELLRQLRSGNAAAKTPDVSV